MLLLMNSEAIEMKRTKTVELFSYIKAEYIKAAENFQHISSDYGRKMMFPLWLEYSLLQRWYSPESLYFHEHPISWHIELPFSGNLLISVDNGEPFLVEPGTFFLLPSGVSNLLRTGPAGYCNKLSFSFSGPFMTSFMANSAMMPPHPVKLDNVEEVSQLVSQIAELLKKNNPKDAPKIAGMTLQLLLTLECAAAHPLPRPLCDAVCILESQIRHPYKISALEQELNLSKPQLLKLFRNHFKMTPKQFFRKRKMEHAAHLLKTTTLTVKAVSSEVGYPDQLSFSHEFKKHFGFSPLEYRKNFST